ncbi:MAG: hypothetical protein AB7W16_13010 [Candidatus Obscuribacterales bacterium]
MESIAAERIAPGKTRFECQSVLKRDAFGQIEQGFFYRNNGERVPAIRRLYTRTFWIRPFACLLAGNEKTALARLKDLAANGQIPELLYADGNYHVRSFIDGEVLYRQERPLSADFYRDAKKLLRDLRLQGVCHNDLAKEANWLVSSDGHKPVLVDFQLARCFKSRHNKLFLALCHEDLRHLLKHKRKDMAVTRTEARVLGTKALPTRIWQMTGRQVYLFITRKVLGWKDRTGSYERDF